MKEMSQLKIQITDMDRRNTRYPPAQKFTVETTVKLLGACPRCGGDHWVRQCPATGSNSIAIKCFLCGQLSHRKADYTKACERCREVSHSAARCIAETSRVAQYRGQTNTITL